MVQLTGELVPGQSVGRYEVLRRLGSGGFAGVYLVHDRALALPDERDVVFAMKVMKVPTPAEFRADSEMLARYDSDYDRYRADVVRQFRTEARILQGCDHPNLPRFYQFFSDPTATFHYLVMDYVEGRTLESVLYPDGAPGAERKPLPEAEVQQWLRQLCNVLSYLHGRDERSIVYRDLKPANVMLEPSGRIKLIDFGIAKMFTSQPAGSDPSPAAIPQTTAFAQGLGTLEFAPPEQLPPEWLAGCPERFRGLKRTDPRSDIYALGAMLYNLLTYERPVNSWQRMRVDNLVPPRQLNPLLSTHMESVILMSMELLPEERFQTVDALWAAASGGDGRVARPIATADNSQASAPPPVEEAPTLTPNAPLQEAPPPHAPPSSETPAGQKIGHGLRRRASQAVSRMKVRLAREDYEAQPLPPDYVKESLRLWNRRRSSPLKVLMLIAVVAAAAWIWKSPTLWQQIKGRIWPSSARIESVPSGAEVWLDGKPCGKTPIRDVETPPRRFELRLVKEGYATWSRELDRDDLVAKEIFRVELTPAGTLVVKSVAEPATLFVDGTKSGYYDGNNTARLSVAAGSHTIRVIAADGRVLLNRRLTVNPRQSLEIDL